MGQLGALRPTSICQWSPSRHIESSCGLENHSQESRVALLLTKRRTGVSFTTSVMVGSNENGEALVYHVICTLLLSDHTSMPRNALVRGSFRMGLSTAEFVKVCKIVVHSGSVEFDT